ncbi:MAG: Fic family protein [Bacteroidia bacterium]
MDWKLAYQSIEALLPIVNRLDAKKLQLDAFRPLPDYALKSLRNSLRTEFSHHSTAIEGNSLSLAETRVVLEDGFTVKGKSLFEHFEVHNHHEALAYVEKLSESALQLNAQHLHDIHALLLQKLEKDFSGRYRNMGVRITGANFTPPNALKVPDLVEELLQWSYGLPESVHLVVKAALFHHRFVWIHPYFDGNGRTARLATALLLMQAGYPPAFILVQDRKRYYAALNAANQGNYQLFVKMMLLAVERSLDLYLAVLEDRTDDFLPLQQLVEEPGVPYAADYLGLMARRGKLAAFKEGKIWYSSKAAVQEYINNRARVRSLKIG